MKKLSTIKIVIWGTGYIAERVYNILKNFEIMTAIDSNPKLQGSYWHNIPIVSFEEYLKSKNNYIIVVTPYDNYEIILKLKSYNYENFLLIGELFFNIPIKYDNMINTNKTYEQIIFLREVLLLLFNERECILREIFEYAFFGQSLLTPNHAINILQKSVYPYISVNNEFIISTLEIIFNNKIINSQKNKSIFLPENTDLFIIHGMSLNYSTMCCALEAKKRNIPILFEEDGFFYSIEPYNSDCPVEFRKRYSTIMDTTNFYINAREPSTIENILNSNQEFSNEEITRAKKCIELICKEKISKYNHQPIIEFNLKKDKKNILIIDQVVGDNSIKYGMANEETFLQMLKTAIKENPDEDIYIKSHPVKNKGHFYNIIRSPNIHIIDYNINPYSLLENMDKVYVCTSQLGFEALMCGKEVHVFGMPFYAGWGVTIDYQKCKRRNKKRSLEEIFYVVYIICSIYVSHTNKCITSIENTIKELVILRKKYLQYKNEMRDKQI